MNLTDIYLLLVIFVLVVFTIFKKRKNILEVFKKFLRFIKRYFISHSANIRTKSLKQNIIKSIMLLILAFIFTITYSHGYILDSLIFTLLITFVLAIIINLMFSFYIYLYFSAMKTYIEVASVEYKAIYSFFSVVVILSLFDSNISLVKAVIIAFLTAIFYLKNVSVLFKMVSAVKQDKLQKNEIWKTVFIIIASFIACLSIFSYTASLLIPNSFSVPVTYFDTLYYTVVTFATVGFGDITPTHVITQAICILNIATSVLCIVFFSNAITSAVSSKEEKGNE